MPPDTYESHVSGHSNTEPVLDATSSQSPAHSAYLSAIRQIEAIPVPDLAATLTTLADDEENEADEANISFLRTQADPQDEWRAQNAEREFLEDRVQRMSRNDRARRDRLQRVLARLNRLHDPAYGDRVPSHNSLYDWSPASESEDNMSEEADLQSMQRELRRQQPSAHPEVLRVIAQAELDAERERRSRSHTSRFLSASASSASQNESSLRSAAMLQAVRRNPRFSARSREYMNRYIADRSERHALEAEEIRARIEESRAILTARRELVDNTSQPSLLHSEPREYHRSDSRPRIERIRRAMLQESPPEPSNTSSSTSLWLPSTMIYLATLRDCKTEEDGLLQAVEFHIATKEHFVDTHDDFLIDVYSLPSTCETSLLAPGAIFEGQQRAHSEFLSRDIPPPPPRRWESDWYGSHTSSSRREYIPRSTLDDVSRQWSTSNAIPSYARRTDSSSRQKTVGPDMWPVKVKIHAVDWKRMTLAATMEAYDVPSHSSADYIPLHDSFWDTFVSSNPNAVHLPSRLGSTNPIKKEERKSITTYLEGEILDFKNFTFRTESFPSNPENDATYWRKLEPFRDFSDEELVARLTSKGYLEHLSRSYILMRWKERCFVRDQPAKSSPSTSASEAASRTSAVDYYDSQEMPDGFTGLTISGFYYVCLRRGDGAVEGLYCDPSSSPYQRLTLERKGEAGLGRFPVWEFK